MGNFGARSVILTGTLWGLACGAPERQPDTASARVAVDTPASAGTVTPSPSPSDTSHLHLSVFVAISKGDGDSPAELLLTASDGRQTGWDPATKQYVADVPGAVYDSARAYADDDVPSSSAQASDPVSNREISLAPKAGDRFGLSVTGMSPGAYVLQVTLGGLPGTRSVRKEARGVRLDSGEVHRYTIQVDSGALTLERVP